MFPKYGPGLKKLMWEKVGIVRNRKDLAGALKQLREWEKAMKCQGPDRAMFELEKHDCNINADHALGSNPGRQRRRSFQK